MNALYIRFVGTMSLPKPKLHAHSTNLVEIQHPIISPVVVHDTFEWSWQDHNDGITPGKQEVSKGAWLIAMGSEL